MCNQMNRKILFSEHLARKVNGSPGLGCELMGEIQLRGKEEKLKIYSFDNSLTLTPPPPHPQK